MADNPMTHIAFYAGAISKDATAAFWVEGCDGERALARSDHLLNNIHADLHKLADLLGYELTKKPTDKETTHEDAA